jgi:small nuclear ribonucleoprotein (snRNP)-like protein
MKFSIGQRVVVKLSDAEPFTGLVVDVSDQMVRVEKRNGRALWVDPKFVTDFFKSPLSGW